MKKKKPARRRKPTARKSTALATRRDVAQFKIDDPHGMLSPAASKALEGFELGEHAHTGGVGLGSVKLSVAERRILSRPVERANVMVLPDSGLAYLPHLHYTRWLNEAFGPTGWGIAPAAKPMKIDQDKGALLIVPHILYIRGAAVAWANGAAEYYEKNKRQTYDDVLESTVAYSLRRCCKRLGMALELWDKRWLRQFQTIDCIQVQTDKGRLWRRRDDPPFDNERGQNAAGTPPERGQNAAQIQPPAGDDGNSKEKITKEQIKRLVGIWRNASRNDGEVQRWLKARYGYKSTADIKRFDYAQIERELTARGDLHFPGDDE